METKSILIKSAFCNPDIHTRICNFVGAHGIKTLGDLTAKTENELRKMRGIGDAAISEIRKVLSEYALTLKNEQMKSNLQLKITRIDNGFILTGDRTLCATDIDSATAMLARALTPVFHDRESGTERQIAINIF